MQKAAKAVNIRQNASECSLKKTKELIIIGTRSSVGQAFVRQRFVSSAYGAVSPIHVGLTSKKKRTEDLQNRYSFSITKDAYSFTGRCAFKWHCVNTICNPNAQSSAMACAHLLTQIIFWRSEQYLGAFDALQGDHDNSTHFSTVLVYMATNAESLGWHFGHRRRRY